MRSPVRYKQCQKCGCNKSYSHFGMDMSQHDYKSICCKLCQPRMRGCQLSSRYKRRDKCKFKDNNKRLLKHEARAIISAYKDVCILCNEDNQACLLFHHLIPSHKNIHISECVNNNYTISETDLHKEISKCVVLCANCHACYHTGKQFSMLADKPALNDGCMLAGTDQDIDISISCWCDWL